MFERKIGKVQMPPEACSEQGLLPNSERSEQWTATVMVLGNVPLTKAYTTWTGSITVCCRTVVKSMELFGDVLLSLVKGYENLSNLK